MGSLSGLFCSTPVWEEDGFVLVDDGSCDLSAEEDCRLMCAPQFPGLNCGTLVPLALRIVEEVDIPRIQAEAVGIDIILIYLLRCCDRQDLHAIGSSSSSSTCCVAMTAKTFMPWGLTSSSYTCCVAVIVNTCIL